MRRNARAVFVAAGLALAGIVGLLLLMGRLSAPPEPTPTPIPVTPTATVSPTSGAPTVSSVPGTATPTIEVAATATPADTSAPVVARVDGVPITEADWRMATLLDSVMSRLAHQPMPSAEETLQRLINEILVLREAGLETARPSVGEVEARIRLVQMRWGLDDEQLVSALESNGLTRQDLSGRVARLIMVERGMEVLAARYPDLDAWLARARTDSEIALFRPLQSVAAAMTPVAPAPAAAPSAAVTSVPAPSPAVAQATAAAQPQAQAPDFSLAGLDNRVVRLSDLRGRPVLLNFWATWCPPCRTELPALQAAFQHYRGQVDFLAVDVKESAETVGQFVREAGVVLPVLLDPNGDVSGGLYRVQGIPTSLIVGVDGSVVARHVGPLSEADIDRYLAPLLAVEKEVSPATPASPAESAALKPAPDFTLASAQGSQVTLSSYRGKSQVVLVFYRGQT
jgi:peroxiredoxin